MVETFTPDVCGSRRRQRLSLVGFALGAVPASALVGAALGVAGSLLGARLALVAAALALVAAGREAGILRLPLPQMRRQVPERWRAELPLPVWSIGYGAGLGVGFLTFQPVATFWVACAAAVALGRPLAAGLGFSAYGAGRAIMVAWPRRGQADATAGVEALVRRRRLLLRANVAALLACAALLAASPAEATTFVLGSGLDPSARGTVFARARMDSGASTVLVQPRGESDVVVTGAASPSVDGDLLAYSDPEGIKVIDWRTGALRVRVDGAVSKPSLDWPLLAFVRVDSTYKRLIVADFTDPAAPTERQIASVLVENELGRPSLVAGRIAWHRATSRESRVLVERLDNGRRTVIARSLIALEANPSISDSRVVWIEQRSRSATLRIRRLDRANARSIYRITGRTRMLWTTALAGRNAYLTRWTLATRAATLVRVRF